jgi:hypothetical protein
MSEKLHLEVICPSSEDETRRFSDGQWVLLGALASVLFSLPLGFFGLWVTRLILPVFHANAMLTYAAGRPWVGVVAVTPVFVSFASASFFGAALYGRFASRVQSWRSACVGFFAAIGWVALAALAGTLRSVVLAVGVFGVLLVIAPLFAWLGGRWGRRLRS